MFNVPFRHWMDFDLEGLWMLSGQGRSSRAIPLHHSVNTTDSNVVDVLPAVQVVGIQQVR